VLQTVYNHNCIHVIVKPVEIFKNHLQKSWYKPLGNGQVTFLT